MPSQVDRGDLSPGLPPTEGICAASVGIDARSAVEIVQTIHQEDRKAFEAVGHISAGVARVVEQVAAALRRGRRLIYLGAGTSGRLGVLDASECLPTFGVGPEGVLGIIAGGDAALRLPVEGAEDSVLDGTRDLNVAGARAGDVVCGIAASGTTPYVWGALAEARRLGCTTVLLTANPGWSSAVGAFAVDHALVLEVGPEIVSGSTRLKAGTATKLVLNTLTTAAMILRGKVHDNLMVDLKPLNKKLWARAVRLVERIAQVDRDRADLLLRESGGEVKTAVILARRGGGVEQARRALAESGGILRKALEPGASSADRPG